MTGLPAYAPSEEHELLRQTVRDLAEAKIAPAAADVDATGRFPQEALDALTGADLHAAHIPESYGGEGADALAAVIIIEEVARACAASSLIPAERLRAAGVPVWVTVVQTVDEATASLRRIFSEALDWPVPEWLGQALEVWSKPAKAGGLRAAIPVWRDPWMVVGSATFTGDIAARLGLRRRGW